MSERLKLEGLKEIADAITASDTVQKRIQEINEYADGRENRLIERFEEIKSNIDDINDLSGIISFDDGEEVEVYTKQSVDEIASAINEDLTTLANNLGGCKFKVIDGVLTVEYEED